MLTSCPVMEHKIFKDVRFLEKFLSLKPLMSNFCILKGNTVPWNGTSTLVPEMDKFTIIYQLKYDLL